MPEGVTIEMSARDAEMVAAWRRARDNIMEVERVLAKMTADGRAGGQQLANTLRNVGQQGSTAGQTIASQFAAATGAVGRTALQLASLSTPLAAVLTVSRLVRQEWDLIVDRQKKASDRQQDVYGAWRNAASQLIGRQTSLTPDILFEKTVRGAQGVDPKELFATFREVSGSAGNIPLEDVLDTVLESARLFPQWTLEERSAVVRGSMLSKKNFGRPTKETFAGVAQAMNLDPTMTASQYGQFVLPSIVALSDLGERKDSFEYLAALTFAFGQRAGDVTGRSSGTNLLNVIRQIRRDAAGAGLIKPDASIQETIGAIDKSPVLQEKLLGVFARTEIGTSSAQLVKQMEEDLKNRRELSVEARKFVAARELMQFSRPGNVLAQEFESVQKSILGFTPEAVREVEQQNQRITASRFAQAPEHAREARQRETAFLATRTDVGVTGAAAEALNQDLTRMGIGPVLRTLAGFEFQARNLTSSDEEDTRRLQMEMTRSAAREVVGGRGIGAVAGMNRVNVEVAKDFLSKEQGDMIIGLLEEANQQRAEGHHIDRKVGGRAEPQKPPVKAVNDRKFFDPMRLK